MFEFVINFTWSFDNLKEIAWVFFLLLGFPHLSHVILSTVRRATQWLLKSREREENFVLKEKFKFDQPLLVLYQTV